MGTILMMDLKTRAQRVLNDENVQWVDDELFDWLNDGQRAVVKRRPDANTVMVDFNCVKGTKQKIPADGYRFIDVPRNSLGNAITEINREILDVQIPNWHTLTPGENAERFCFDPRNPTVFFLYPPVIDSHEITLSYSQTPVDVKVVSGAETISLDDAWAEAILNWCLFRAFTKDSLSNPAHQTVASSFYQLFSDGIGQSVQADQAFNPNG